MLNITVTKRDLKEKEKENEIKGVFYGAKSENTSIFIPLNDFKKVWAQVGESGTLILKLGKEEINVLINEVQLHPITNIPIHVDFLAIDMNKKVTVSVPLKFVGVAPVVKNGIGILVKVLRDVEIEALPKALPKVISIDLSSLVDLDSVFSIKDLILPEGVLVTAEDDKVILSVASLKEEIEEEIESVDLSDIEVEQKGKKEEEGSEDSISESKTEEKKVAE